MIRKIYIPGLFFSIWMACIALFSLDIVLGTNFFRQSVTDSTFGKSQIFTWLLSGTVAVGIISFLCGIGALILADIVKNKSSRIVVLVFIAFLLAGFGGFFYSNLRNKVPILTTTSLFDSIIHKEDVNGMRNKIFILVNEERTKAGLEPLKESQQLETSALNKVNDMFAKNYWAHISPEGNTPWVLFGQVKYSYRFAGENLARDFYLSDTTVAGWMNSPGHKENILNSNYTETGIAVVDGNMSGVTTRLIVQHFGKPLTINTVASKTGNIINYHDWCLGKNISVYENEIIVKKSSDGNTYGMTSGDWICYENFLSGKSAPVRVPSRTGKIIPYHEWCTGKDISIYDNELVLRTIDGKGYSMTQGDWYCYDKKNK